MGLGERPEQQQQNQPQPQFSSSSFHSGIRHLSWHNEAGLMSGVQCNGGRIADSTRKSSIYRIQQYIIRNNSTFWDRGENTIYEIPSSLFSLPTTNNNNQNDRAVILPEVIESMGREIYNTKIVRDGSIIGYDIHDVTTGDILLKIHDHGDTNSSVQRTFKAFFRSPIKKWDVENRTLFSDVPNGIQLGIIHDVYPDHRVFFPHQLARIPRLEMQTMASFGRQYALAVTDIPEPIGWVQSSIVGRVAPRSETYGLVLKNCTREEAVLWITMVIATDMKRRRVQNTQYGRTGLLTPALI